MRIKSSGSTVGKIVMAIVFVSMIGGVYIAPAFGKNGKDKQGHYQQQGRYEHGQYVYVHGRRVYQPRPYYHPQPVYAPPPVVYYPEPSPGISLVFPIIIR